MSRIRGESEGTKAPSEGQPARLEQVRSETGFRTIREFWEALRAQLEGEELRRFPPYSTARSYHTDREASWRYLTRVAEVFPYSLTWLASGKGEPHPAPPPADPAPQPATEEPGDREAVSKADLFHASLRYVFPPIARASIGARSLAWDLAFMQYRSPALADVPLEEDVRIYAAAKEVAMILRGPIEALRPEWLEEGSTWDPSRYVAGMYASVVELIRRPYSFGQYLREPLTEEDAELVRFLDRQPDEQE